MEPLTPGRVTSRAGSPSLSHRAFPPFCPQPPHGAPSSLLCSPQLCQRDGLPVPFQIPAFLMPLGVRQVWASHTPSRLAAPCSRNGFVILRTGSSPSVALHPALRQRSYFRFRVGGAYPEGTCTPLTLRLGGALGSGPCPRYKSPDRFRSSSPSSPSLSMDSGQKKAPNNCRGVEGDCRRAGRGQQNTRVTLSSLLAAAMAAIRVAVAAGSWGKAPSGQMRTHCWQRTQCSAITG